MSAYFAKDKEINLLFDESQAMYRKMLESLRTGVFMADAKDNLFYINPSFLEIMGYHSKEEMLGLNVAERILFDAKERERLFQQMEKTGFICDHEVKARRKDGSVALLCLTGNFIRNDREEIIGYQGVVQDVTEKRQLEDRIHKEKGRLEEVLSFVDRVGSIHQMDKLADLLVNRVASIMRAEKCSLMLVDELRDELCIRSAKGLSEDVVTTTRIKMGEGIAGIVAQKGRPFLVADIEEDIFFKRKNQPCYTGKSFLSVPFTVDDRVIGVVNVADKDIKEGRRFGDLDLKILTILLKQAATSMENAALSKELKFSSSKDPLTDLDNYRCFVEAIDNEVQRSKRYGTTFSLLMIDVDDLKSYNDVFGQVEGDKCLKELGGLLKAQVRAVDKICRYGGDEFVILLPGTNALQARSLAERLQKKIEECSFKRPLTVSIGGAEFRKSLNRFELTMKADRALSQAKREESRTHIYD